MKPITCKHITCPPIPHFGDEIETECTYWDESCHLNLDCEAGESHEDCMCHQARSRCKNKNRSKYGGHNLSSWLSIKTHTELIYDNENLTIFKSFKPMMQLKDETNDLRWTSFSFNVCSRVANTTYGRWWFSDQNDIATATCREYTDCMLFGNKKEINDNRIIKTCENLNGSNNNCARLIFSCPEGLRPSVDYVTCEKNQELANNWIDGEWRFPAGVKPHRIKCLKDHDFDENPITTTESTPETRPSPEPTSESTQKLLCEDLSDLFFDETVDVSFVVAFSLKVKPSLRSHVPRTILSVLTPVK